jgi:hypothetical protein
LQEIDNYRRRRFYSPATVSRLAAGDAASFLNMAVRTAREMIGWT